MLRSEFTFPKSDPKKKKLKDLPTNMREGLLATAKWQYEQKLAEYTSVVANNRAKEQYLFEELQKLVKQLACKHEIVYHDKSSGITDNVVDCKECGLGWSDY